MSKVKLNRKTINVAKFHSIALAKQSLAHRIKPAWIVAGDYYDPYGRFWICRPIDASRLEKVGYEILK